jgi:hypothetical protein
LRGLALLGALIAAPTRAQTPAPAAAPAPSAPAAKSGPVKLLRAGAAPLAPLRLQLSKTAVEKGEFSLAMSVEMETPQGPQKITPPKVGFAMTASHARASAADSVAVSSKFGGLHVDGPNAAAIEAKLKGAGLDKFNAEYVVTNRGLVTRSDAKIGPEMAPELRQMLDQMKSVLDLAMLPFPEEPVGVGAEWQQESGARTTGMDVEMTSTYELVERTKSFVRIKRTVVQKAKPGTLQLPAGGPKVELLSLEGEGGGEIRQALDQVLPSALSLDLHLRMSMKAQGQTFKQNVNAVTAGSVKLVKK